MDPQINNSLTHFGFAQVIVVWNKDALPVGALPTVRSSSGGYFLPHLPDAVAAASLSAPQSVASQPAVARYFPRLGISVGYVDPNGAFALDAAPEVQSLHQAEMPSLIRPINTVPVPADSAALTDQLTWGLQRLGIEALWAMGLRGGGIRVGHLDTGVDRHPAIERRIAGFLETDFDGNRIADSGPVSAHDTGIHGTHTAGTICGSEINGLAIGVAPEADLFSAVVIEGGNVVLRVLEGMEWVLENQVRVLSMSLGIRGFTPAWLEIVRRLGENGVLPVFAIGNEGTGTSRSPGNYGEALSVGAIDSNSQVALFSSSITVNDPKDPNRPDVVAPGVDIISAAPGGGLASKDGTSMATPHVAGLAALLFQHKPAASVDDVEGAILSTCLSLPGQSPLRFGHGVIDPRGAVGAL